MNNDYRLALRMLRQRPLFAAIAILSIAIGIGAATTIFSVVNAVLLETPPGVAQPERVVEIGRTNGGGGFDTFSFPELIDLQSQAKSLDAIAGWRLVPLSFSAGRESERIMAMAASADYFTVFGLKPALGRFYSREEDRVPDANPVAVVSHAFWRDRLASDPAVIGKTIDINRHVFTVIGVAPADFVGNIPVVPPDVYIPLTMFGISRPGFDSWNVRWASWLVLVGRLKPDATHDQANAELAALFRRFAQPNEDLRNARSAKVIPFSMMPGPGRTPVRAFLTLLLGFVGLVLLITCANVAGMLIARAAAREKEIAIRLAIGSSRGAIIRQLVAESLVLFSIGGAAGVLLARWAASAVSAIQLPTPIPVQLDFSANNSVLALGLAVALISGLLFGLIPAIQASRPSVAGFLKSESARRGTRGSKLRRTFVMAQIAFSLILLACSGLFLRSLQRAAGVDTGFDPAGVKLVSFDLNMEGYDAVRGPQFQQRLLASLQATPGVISAALGEELPLDLGISERPAIPEDWQGRPEDQRQLRSAFSTVSADYFSTLSIPILRGRDFSEADRTGAPEVAVVSREFAQRAWPDQDPIGKRFKLVGDGEPWITVVGVAADVKNQTLMESVQPQFYRPSTQNYQASLYLLVKGNNAVTRDAIRQVMLSVDPRLSTGLVQELSEYTALGTMPQRIAASLTTALGLLALLLSAMGVYGVIAFTVAQRTREIGTRMALGADRRSVLQLVLADGLRLAVPGVIIGLIASLALAQLLRSFILGVAPADPFTFALVPLTMVAVISIACLAPARKAAGIEPIHALKSD